MADKTQDKSAVNDKERNLQLALAKIEKDFGKGAIMRLGETEIPKVEAISTGCLTLDVALGIGGIPKGRIIEIYGPESSGKTTVALHCVAEVQKEGGTAAFVDAEPCARSRVCVQTRRKPRRPLHFPTRQWRASA